MMEQGWIYVLVNSSIPGMVKVGRTTRRPAQRAAELSGATGVATPFVLAFEQDFADCAEAEATIHAELDRRALRVAANREFFRGSPAEIVRVILQVAAEAGRVPELRPVPSVADLIAEADRHLFGHGDTLQDYAEAVRCYRLAATRGSLVALERLGALYAHLRGKSRAERRRAMRYLKDGARRGNYFCYCEMAAIYAVDGHYTNFAKAWDLFFARRADSFNQDVEGGPYRYADALRVYIANCLDIGQAPAHIAELKEAADSIVAVLVQVIDEVRDAPEARQRLAGVLRWAYQNLRPGPPQVERNTSPTDWIAAWVSRPRGAAA